MIIEPTPLVGLVLISPTVHGDHRGWFMESYNHHNLLKFGIHANFIQDNHSFSAHKGTLRGLHFQHSPKAQSKLVRCVKGSIWDVCVDLRKGSPSYLKWFGVILSEENKLQIFIPKGFAHGFLTLTDNVEIEYKVDELYDPSLDSGIHYLDSTLSINWQEGSNIKEVTISSKDSKLPSFDPQKDYFIYGEDA